jgi:hypothetical protein
MSKSIAQLTAAAKRTKKYAALLGVGLTEDAALRQLGVVAADTRVADLVAAGFTQADAEAAVALADGTTSTTPAPVAPVAETSKSVGEALVAQRGLAFSSGRVYVNGGIIEAAARVLKTGAPEIATSSGVGRTKAVLVFREESGDVALQNLRQPV